MPLIPPETPWLTVDIIIELVDHPGVPIVLIERKYPPLGWALPGGFVDRGERIEHAAIREAQEETSLTVVLQALLGMYSDPQRDARCHTASAVYVARAHGSPVAADDARRAIMVIPDGIDVVGVEGNPLVFDHGLIMADYVRYRNGGGTAPVRV